MQDSQGIEVGEHFNGRKLESMLIEAGLEEATDCAAIYLVRTVPVDYAHPPSTVIVRLFTETSTYPPTTD